MEDNPSTLTGKVCNRTEPQTLLFVNLITIATIMSQRDKMPGRANNDI